MPEVTEEKKPKPPLVSIRFIINLVLVALMLWVAWYVIGKYMEFNAYSLTHEAKNNLKAIHEAQVKYRRTNGAYAAGARCFQLLEWAPDPDYKTMFDYYCGADKIARVKKRGECDHEPPPASKTGFPVVAIGSVDGDPKCDVWTINEAGKVEHPEHDLEFY